MLSRVAILTDRLSIDLKVVLLTEPVKSTMMGIQVSVSVDVK